MTGIGESLRQARVERGLDLKRAAAALNARERYLADLEAERFDRLPAPFYTRGFLREYAELLGLDSQLLLAWYDQEHAQGERPEIVARPTAGLPRRRAFPGPRTAAAIAIGLLALTVWAFGQTSSGPSRLGPFERRTAVAPPAVLPVRQRATAPSPRPVAVLAAARGDCWLSARVDSRSGAVVWEGTLRQGKTLRLSVKRPLWIRLGAPWNLDVRLSGKRVPAPAGTQPANVLVSRRGLVPA